MLKKIVLCFLLYGLSTAAFAQSPGILKGQVADESGAVIPGAKVTAAGPNGVVKNAATIGDGTYTLIGLAPGAWTVRASSPGLSQQSPAKINITSGTQTLNLVLRVALEKQEVTVQEQTNNQISLDPSNNAGAIVLKGEDLDALSDDPDDLAQDLQALAGPAAGPNGGQIYIDGFTGGQLPPKEAIREIRINSNPFSSEYDRLGFGRIEIFTKPGTDKFHGSASFDDSDGIFNSRNPFLTGTQGQPFEMPGFQTRTYNGNLSGPLSKRASFFFDFERREIDDAAVINARIVEPTTVGGLATFAEEPYAPGVSTSQRRTSFSPRIDYALTPNNTLMARYRYMENDLSDTGIGSFSLPWETSCLGCPAVGQRGYPMSTTNQTGQLTETAVINSKWINETRLQIMNTSVNQNGGALTPVISVAGAFTSGGSGIGQSSSWQRSYEIQNYTSTTKGTHSIKFGVRVRTNEENDVSQSNFGGTWTFSAPPAALGAAVTSLDVYLNTLQRLAGLTPSGPSAPSLYTITQCSASMPNCQTTNNTQTDIGVFYQDDWRLKPNFTLSLGGRYETQTNIHDWTDFAPRVGFAWAPGSKTTGTLFSRPKLVIRGGFGVFYDRINQNLTIQELHYQQGQESFRTTDPTLLADYPLAPPPSALGQSPSNIKIQLDRNMHAPYVAQSAIAVERQLPWNTSLTVTFTNTRGVHELMERDINAPLPGTYIPGQPNTGFRPYGNSGEIYNYETDGILNQNQIIINANTRISNKVSLFGGYFYNHALSNAGGGLPANDYDLAAEYGRANFDIRHRGVVSGTIATKWGLRWSPFIILNTGGPFDIISPVLAGSSTYNLRPAFAPAGTPVCSETVASNCAIDFQGNLLDPYPYLPDGSLKPGEKIIPHNFGQSPGSVTVNLRLSRTWGFGPERTTAAQRSGGGPGGDHGGGGGPRGGGGGGGSPHGPMGGMGGGMRGGGGMFGGGASSTRKYQLTLSANARNLLNHTNYGPINGLLGSPTFGTSTTMAGGFGAENSPLNNRRIDFQLRFSF